MPLTTDEKVVGTANGIISTLQGVFGKHAGYRPAHAKGILLSGTFTPSAIASTLSTAPHFSAPSTPVTLRFSNSTGIPNIPDTDHHADPRGLAVRFHLGGRSHTDVIAHSTPFFPVRTGEEFKEFFEAIATSPADAPHPTPVEKFVTAHPPALAFVKAPKPPPASFVKEKYFGVNAFKFVDKEGKATFVRYQLAPVLGVETYDDEALKGKSANYLQEELRARLSGSGAFKAFRLLAQIAAEGDVTDDATVHWPETREVIELGVVEIEKEKEVEFGTEQKTIIFDPIPRVQGIEPSNDPLLEVRAAVYLISGRERRAAP